MLVCLNICCHDADESGDYSSTSPEQRPSVSEDDGKRRPASTASTGVPEIIRALSTRLGARIAVDQVVRSRFATAVGIRIFANKIASIDAISPLGYAAIVASNDHAISVHIDLTTDVKHSILTRDELSPSVVDLAVDVASLTTIKCSEATGRQAD